MLTVYYNGRLAEDWDAFKNVFKSDIQKHIKDVSYIEASGKELETIKMIFCPAADDYSTKLYTIPYIKGIFRMRWSGDIAKTILLNL